MTTTDHPDYYDEATLKAWAEEFNKPEAFYEDGFPKSRLPGISLSYYDIARALRRIDNIKGALED